MNLLALTLAATNVVLVSPWSNGNLRHDFTVSEKVTGYCWVRSLATDRPDAWRCMAGNDIYDPCFSQSASSKTAACMKGPFSKDVVLMRLTKPLAHTRDVVDSTSELRALRLRGEPWGLRLLDGQTCVYMTGATDVVAGMRLNFACTHGWGLGLPDRSTAIWEVPYIASLENRALHKMGIATAAF
jgi:hypothetical protein